MAVHSLTTTIQFVQCDFCGSVYHDHESARIHHCMAGDPPLPENFHEGDTVVARLKLGSGLEHVGFERGECKILRFQKPNAAYPWQPKFNFGGLESPPTVPHEWLVVVQPIGKPKKEGAHFLSQEVIRVSCLELKPDDKSHK